MKPVKVSAKPPKGWPTEKEWNKLDKILEKAPGSRVLPSNASLTEKFKYKLCREFVVYLHEEDITQRELARKLDTTEARVSEIVHYHLDKVTIDRLVGYLGIIKPGVKFEIAS
jgi:predicted XRE-type DNA-binding protein